MSLGDAIQKAVKNGKLKQPFTAADVKKACKGYDDVTYSSHLVHHRKKNPIKASELYERDSKGKFRLISK